MLYPHINDLLEALFESHFDVALVTNGTAMSTYQAGLIGNNMVGVRVSLDAGTPDTYAKIKQVSKKEWNKAINTIKTLRCHKGIGELSISVGYVLNKFNLQEIAQAAQIVKEIGANSIRISVAFTPWGINHFNKSDLIAAREQAYNASVKLNGDSFQVINQLDDKLDSLNKRRQDYDFCAQQSMSVVVGADQSVYTCCMLAYNKKGFMGSLKEGDFVSLWNNSISFRSKFRPDKTCTNECNYEHRNKLILSALDQSDHINRSFNDIASLHHNIL